MIGLVDYGMGNRRSVEKALEHVGARVLVSSDPAALAEARGLVVPGAVRELAAGDLKLPQIGWNEVRWERRAPFLDGVRDAPVYYHVHSYIGVPDDPDTVVGTAEYGERFPAVVARGSFVGVQFHPEKSSHDGLALLAGWLAVCDGAAGVAVRSGRDLGEAR